MNKLAALLSILALAALAGCGKQEPSPATQAPSAAPAPAETAPADAGATEEAATTDATTPTPPTETISETEDTPDAPADDPQSAAAHPSVRLGAASSRAPTSAQFKEGTSYEKIVPAQPTNVAPGKVEVLEVFWYGCPHCYALDPAIESWRSKGKPAYAEFVRVPAMWNDNLRMHARVYYTAEELGKLEELHPLIFREINVNQNPLNTAEKIGAFFEQHGVGREAFSKAFSSFTVESKLQRADFLNRRYRVQSAPLLVVNGKYRTSLSAVGGEGQEAKLFSLVNELSAHEHGG